jgi:glycosyltransferase involved in cell wall biosynthesis
MSLGIPSIVSNIPENLEVVTDKFDSLLFDPNDHKDLCQKLQFVLNSKTLYKTLSLNAINTVKTKYDIDNISNIYSNLYNQLLLK